MDSSVEGKMVSREFNRWSSQRTMAESAHPSKICFMAAGRETVASCHGSPKTESRECLIPCKFCDEEDG